MKVWTHAGQFHADEVSAIALLKLYLEEDIEVIRSFSEPKEYDIAVDIGGKYDGITKFDHHHDGNLEAACVLIGEWLVKNKRLDKEVWDEMYKWIFKYMSKVDRGIIPGGGDSQSINALIRNLNSSNPYKPSNPTKCFNNAVNIMYELILGAHYSATTMLIEDKNWKGFKKHDGIVEMDKKCRRWRYFAKKVNIKFAVSVDDRDSNKGALMATDSLQWPIPSHEKQDFLHSSRFLAIYESYQDALEHALELSANYVFKTK